MSHTNSPNRLTLSGRPRITKVTLFACLLALFVPTQTAAAPKPFSEKPKVRAITAFIRLDRGRYEDEIRETLAVLRKGKAALARAGYEVQTLRITTQPFPEYITGLSREEALAFFQNYDRLVAKEGFVAAIGPAMLADDDDPRQAELLGEILVAAPHLDATLIVAGGDGVRWKAVRAAAKMVKYVAERTPHSQGVFHFAAAAVVPPLTPFYPASYHTGTGRRFGIALQSANVVAEVLAAVHSPADAKAALTTALSRHAQKIEVIARDLEKETLWAYQGIDLSPAPLKDVSIGEAIEKFTGSRFGSSGTMTAVSVITSALRDVPVKHAGYSGLMLPVLEDTVLAQRWSEGGVSVDALLSYSAVCGTGLDTIPLPGDISEEQLGRIIGDMASLAVKLHKPLSARLLPVTGKKPGDKTEFDDPMLVNAVLQPLP